MATPLNPTEIVAVDREVSRPAPSSVPNTPGYLGTSIGGGRPSGFQWTETQRDGTEITYWRPASGSRADKIEIERGKDQKQADQWQQDQKLALEAEKAGPSGLTAQQLAEQQRHNQATEAQNAATASRQVSVESRQATTAQGTLDLNVVKQKYEEEKTRLDEEYRAKVLAGQNAAQASLDRERQINAYYKENVEGPIAQANQKLAEDRAKLEREKFQAEQVTTAGREQTRQREAGATFAYNAGQDAVSNAMKLLPYQVGPTFGAEFSKAISGFGKGDDAMSFSPSALTYDAPDYNQIAEQAAQRAHQLWTTGQTLGQMPVAQPGAVPGAPAPAALAALPVQQPVAGYVPPAPVMPSSVGGNTGVVGTGPPWQM